MKGADRTTTRIAIDARAAGRLAQGAAAARPGRRAQWRQAGLVARP